SLFPAPAVPSALRSFPPRRSSDLLIQRGHQVVVECGAGMGAGYPDGDYEQAGAKLVDGHAAVFEQADLLVKVKEPQPSEYPLLRDRKSTPELQSHLNLVCRLLLEK